MTPGDVREGGSWTAAQRCKNNVLYIFCTTALRVLGWLPLGMLDQFGAAVGWVAHAFAPQLRTVARRQLGVAFPGKNHAELRALARANLIQLGRRGAETIALLAGRPLPRLALSQRAQIFVASYMQSPQPTLLCALHLGPWERVAHTLVAAGIPLTTLARTPYDPRFLALYAKLRQAHGVGVAYRESPAALRGALRHLRGGGVLGAPMDLRSRVPAVTTPFMGGECAAARGPADIALRTKCQVVVAAVVPAADGELELDIEIVASAQQVVHNTAAQLTAAIYAIFEARIRALPTEWPWIHDREIRARSFGAPDTSA